MTFQVLDTILNIYLTALIQGMQSLQRYTLPLR